MKVPPPVALVGMVGMAGAGIVAIVEAVELLVVASALENVSAPVVLLPPPPQANSMTTIDKPAVDITAAHIRFNFIKIRSMDVNSTPCHRIVSA